MITKNVSTLLGEEREKSLLSKYISSSYILSEFYLLVVSISAHVHQHHYYAISEFHVNTPKEKKFKFNFYDSPLMALMKSLLSTNNLFPAEIRRPI